MSFSGPQFSNFFMLIVLNKSSISVPHVDIDSMDALKVALNKLLQEVNKSCFGKYVLETRYNVGKK